MHSPQDLTLGIKADITQDITRKYISNDSLPTRIKSAHNTSRKTQLKALTVTACKSFVEMSDGSIMDEDELDQIKELFQLTGLLLELVKLDLNR